MLTLANDTECHVAIVKDQLIPQFRPGYACDAWFMW